MKRVVPTVSLMIMWFAVTLPLPAQEVPPADQSSQLVDQTQHKIEEISKKLDESEEANKAAAGILKPIYVFAEYLSFPAFHWIAFAIMLTGVVSFALQIILGKLVVLSKLGFSPTEIISDILGLVISLVGLVLTTQAATENSNFTSSPAAVLSASVVGAAAGYVFYMWGQDQEVQAAKGRRKLD